MPGTAAGELDRTRLRRIKELVVTRNGMISLGHSSPSEGGGAAVSNPYDPGSAEGVREVAPGLKLEQITPDGMIFSYKGYRFSRGVRSSGSRAETR